MTFIVLKKTLPALLLIFLSFLAGCDSDKSNHKNNNTQVKSASLAVPDDGTSLSKTIAQTIFPDTTYSILTELLKATDLSEVLTKPGPFTFFAPVNPAFRSLPEGTLEGLIERKNDLVNVLSHHIVAGLLRTDDIDGGQRLKTLAGDELIVTKRNDEILINGVKINTPGIRASNGIVYVINDLFFPKDQNPGAY